MNPSNIKKGLARFFGAPYDPRRLSHKFAALVSVLLCLAAVPVFFNCFADAKDPIAYPLEDGVNSYNPYVQQFDAFEKGQLEIDFPVSPRLTALENPYDYTARHNSGAYFLWDRAMYGGKYYSYFGIAPVIAVYYPYYLATGALPGDSFTLGVFLFITALFLPLALFGWAEAFGQRTPLILLMFAVPSLFAGSGILLTLRGLRHFYFFSVAAGTAFLSAFLFFAFAAYNARAGWRRCLLLIAAGISYSLVFLSRPNIALLAAFPIVPGLWFMIIRRRDENGSLRRARRIIAELASLGAPVIAAAGFTMWFNAARFSGPFDFGASYQLTVADVSTYRMRLTDLPLAIYNYFLALPGTSDIYPYITFTDLAAVPAGHYVYTGSNIGLAAFPLTLVGTLALLFVRGRNARRHAFVGSTLFGLIFTAWFDFCMGGVVYRYTVDLMLVAAMLSAITLLSLYNRAAASERLPKWAKCTSYAVLLLFFAAAFVSALRISLINGENIPEIRPEVLAVLEKLLPFASPTK